MRGNPRTARRAGGIVLALALLGPVSAEAQEACVERRGPTPGESGLRELGPNTARPTFTVPLDSGTEASDDITFPVKEDQSVGTTAGSATAGVEQPRKEGRRLKADITASARPSELGTEVRVFVCISNKGRGEAGTYEGAVHVYGPRFGKFTYPLVVTTKWPVWVPLVIIGAVLGVFLIAELLRSETGVKGNGLYLVIAVAAGGVTYFAQYDSVDTWGDDPATQLAGLAVAVVTAAAAGRAAAKKFFGGEDG